MLEEHVQLEFPFTKVGFMQQRAITQDKYLHSAFTAYVEHNRDDSLPEMTFDKFELDYGDMYMRAFAHMMPLTEKELKYLL